MLVLLVSAASSAAELPRLDYLFWTARPELASREAAEHLREHPLDWQVHRTWAWMQVEGLRGGDDAIALYRAWAEADPSELLPKVLAGTIASWQHRGQEMGPWCELVEAGIPSALPVEPDARYQVVRLDQEAHEVCPGTARYNLDDLDDLELPQAVVWSTSRRFGLTHTLDEAQVDRVLAALDQGFEHAATSLAPLLSEAVTGAPVDRLRAELRRRAERRVASDDPVQVWVGSRLFRALRDVEGEQAALERVRLLDPEAAPTDLREGTEGRWLPRDPWDQALQREVQVAARRRRPASVRELTALEARVPDEGPLRVAWHETLGRELDRGLLPGPVLPQWQAAFEADPGRLDALLRWAEAVEERRTDPGPALVALDSALARPPAWDARLDDPAVEDWAGYRERQLVLRAELYEVQARLLDRAERPAEALEAARFGVLLRESATLHEFAAWLCQRLERPEEATFHLGRAVALARDTDSAAFERLRRRAEDLHEQLGWADVDTWIAARRGEGGSDGGPEPSSGTDSYRVGRPFPDLDVKLRDGRTVKLSTLGELRVVDLWATWCGPCVASLPMLQQVAHDWADRGVTVVVLSVDEEEAAWRRYRGFGPDLTIGWIGQAGYDALKIHGIPSTFVVDGAGVVRSHHAGFGTGDDRLEDELGELVGER